MAIIKCKMCGGDIALAADKTFGTCEYCGSTVTLPKIDDEQRAAAFNRGNHFRRSGEFDKALAVYERIVAEDDTDAEAHWCCALCRFGIEYVEDPATYEWLPTCHRASFDSFLEDVDYLAAVEHSDGVTRRQYQRDAVKIAEVRRGILATSQNEEPFDVFICYKETDAAGNRTVDSTLAQDIYYQLTESGYRVFFARITLEDKGGAEYEPYIFAALNSAKIMVAVGTKPEHFNAVWVKNEWSRFLAMMRHDRSKLLLPCYRDMDPYDLPEQLSVLQSYDMSKIGFVQDLLRGIKKVLDANKKPEPVKETVVVQSAGADVAPLLKRAFMFLEDGDWQSAEEYCEKVLDKDPECAEAYLGKLMSELRVRKQADLRNQREPFDGNANYQKVVRFGTADLKAALAENIKFIKERNEKARIEGIYTAAVKMAETAKTETDFKAAAAELQRISQYKDSAALAQKYLEKAEECRKNAIYNDAKASANKNTIKDCEAAIKKFQSIPCWKDAYEQITLCNQKIDELKRKAEADKKAAAQRAKKAKKIVAICAAVVVVIIAAALLTTKLIIPNAKYNDAVALMEAGQYVEAECLFSELGDYKDSETMLKDCQYNKAIIVMEAGLLDEAGILFKALDGYKDSADKFYECTQPNNIPEQKDMEAIINLILAMGPDGYGDTEHFTEDQYNAFWDAFWRAGEKFAQEIIDYCVAAGYGVDSNDVATAAGAWGYYLEEGATAADFFAAIIETHGYNLGDDGINYESASTSITEFLKAELDGAAEFY